MHAMDSQDIYIYLHNIYIYIFHRVHLIHVGSFINQYIYNIQYTHIYIYTHLICIYLLYAAHSHRANPGAVFFGQIFLPDRAKPANY